MTDNIKFWKLVKLFFTGKKSTNTKITLIKGNEIISDAAECAEIMNNFFSDVAINLAVDRNIDTEATNASGPVTIAIEKYNNHPSIIKLNQQNFPKSNFDFQNITESSMLKVIEDLDLDLESYQKDNIPSKILKDNKDICTIY